MVKLKVAEPSDNLITILELIYDTDEYIYPVLMPGNLKDNIFILSQGMYHFNNITLATIKGEIAGLCVSFDNKAIQPEAKNIKICRYLKDLILSIGDDEEYINNICVLKKFRKLGIATKLINNVIANTSKKKVILDCLADNTKAIKLYQKLGFTIISTDKAFSINDDDNKKAVRMEKKL